MTKEIAIFSTSIDEPTYGTVARELESRGYNPWIYKADKVVSGEDNLTLEIRNSAKFILKYCGIERELGKISSAWFRQPNIFGLNYNDKATQMSVEKEVSLMQESIWEGVPEVSWFNSPSKMKKIQAKLAQLSLATSLGFEIPQTIVSNNWDEIEDELSEQDIAVKMSSGLIYKNSRSQVLYTSRLKLEDREKLRNNSPFPAIYQTFLDKSREWRVTVVGDRVFSSSIYCDEDSKTDWRRYQLTNKIQFKDEKLPEDQSERCIRFLEEVGLKYGAFDFIEDHDGKITFLECNANGQYKWLENLFNFPISESIASELIKIHQNNKG